MSALPFRRTQGRFASFEEGVAEVDEVSLDAIFELMEGLSSRMMRELHREMLQRLPFKATSQQMTIAVILNRQGGRMTVTDVANEFGVSLSAVTASANRMSLSGLLRRFRDEADRRVVWLELTPGGREAVDDFLEVRGQVRLLHFDLLSEQDRADLYRILSRLREAEELPPDRGA
jgi:DNA-binding MarR family transcriptional regulator